MSEPIDYYVAAIVDGIEQSQDSGTREDGACTLPLSTVVNSYSSGGLLGKETLLLNYDLLMKSLDMLAKQGFLEVWSDDIGETIIYIKDPQALFDSMEGNLPFQRLYLLNDNGRSWLAAALDKINSKASNDLEREYVEQVSDDQETSGEEHAWEPLPVELDDPDLADAISLSEQAIAVIEASNGYADSEPSERNSIVNSMKGSLQSLKAGMPSRKAILEGLYAPMKYIAKKFTDAAMGKAAASAVIALAKWLSGI
ncbi:hypothetical protein EOB36_30065 [Mesorhizobium sp. M6A.T.Cr.TU.017.01.1.1]|uniref:hypothetical protein n=1 Tax=Mesorhizobium sp. M6A.T.Cr.TU.017.01.1.1 TaxID=2496774 RepID=UPI000FD55AE4|nr:hypothetical protein [Mesorhizobium sp. M6A.T.Cr.TU.017.01.1.1]RUU96355.1 hypothetical protein EOB36_30065 [Mesorhizobium sp. M6A.T.Cr.TU.017.01.1.1]